MKRLISAAVLALVSVSAWMPNATAGEKSSHDHYAAIIDAGSSGSRIYLYKIRFLRGKLEIKDLFSYYSGRYKPNIPSCGVRDRFCFEI